MSDQESRYTERDGSLDELAKGLHNGTLSRRKALRLLGAALVGGAFASMPGVAWAAKGGNRECVRCCKEMFGPGRERGQCIRAGARGECPVTCDGGNGGCPPERLCESVDGPVCIPQEEACPAGMSCVSYFRGEAFCCEPNFGGCCSPEEACGSECCGFGETCINGACVCPSQEVCGGICCSLGETCLTHRQFGFPTCCPPEQVCDGVCCQGPLFSGTCCNGVCCPGDESCVNGQCECGTGPSCPAGTTCISGSCCPNALLCCSPPSGAIEICCPEGTECVSQDCTGDRAVSECCPLERVCGGGFECCPEGEVCSSPRGFGCVPA